MHRSTNRSTLVLALAGLLAGSALGAQPPAGPPAGPPPGQPPVAGPDGARGRMPGRRPFMDGGMRRRDLAPGQPGGMGPGAMGPGGRMGPGSRMGFGRPGRGPGMGPGMGRDGAAGGSLATQLLSSTGELKLTDQQVTRLAAIARRSTDRRQALRTRMDSLGRALRADTAARRRAFTPGAPRPAGPLDADVQRMREQEHADLRDALSVLTPEQQALAWERRSRRGR